MEICDGNSDILMKLEEKKKNNFIKRNNYQKRKLIMLIIEKAILALMASLHMLKKNGHMAFSFGHLPNVLLMCTLQSAHFGYSLFISPYI